MGHTYTKTLYVAYLKFKCDWMDILYFDLLNWQLRLQGIRRKTVPPAWPSARAQFHAVLTHAPIPNPGPVTVTRSSSPSSSTPPSPLSPGPLLKTNPYHRLPPHSSPGWPSLTTPNTCLRRGWRPLLTLGPGIVLSKQCVSVCVLVSSCHLSVPSSYCGQYHGTAHSPPPADAHQESLRLHHP